MAIVQKLWLVTCLLVLSSLLPGTTLAQGMELDTNFTITQDTTVESNRLITRLETILDDFSRQSDEQERNRPLPH